MHPIIFKTKDLPASTLVGLTWKNPALDPLTVLHLNNQLDIIHTVYMTNKSTLLKNPTQIAQITHRLDLFQEFKVGGTCMYSVFWLEHP